MGPGWPREFEESPGAKRVDVFLASIYPLSFGASGLEENLRRLSTCLRVYKPSLVGILWRQDLRGLLGEFLLGHTGWESNTQLLSAADFGGAHDIKHLVTTMACGDLPPVMVAATRRKDWFEFDNSLAADQATTEALPRALHGLLVGSVVEKI